jgi:phosphotransferase family enzyme
LEDFDSWRPYIERVHGAALEGLHSIDGGEVNRVVLAERPPLAFRLPRFLRSEDPGLAATAAGLAQSGIETLAVLSEAHSPPPVPIPRVVDTIYQDPYDDAPLIICQTRLPGTPLATTFVRTHFSGVEKALFGRRVAACVVWLADAIPMEASYSLGVGDQVRPVWRSPYLDHFGNFMRYIDRGAVKEMHRRSYPHLAAAAGALAAELREHAGPGRITPTIFGHYDMRPENFLFAKNHEGLWEPSAWLDFEAARPTTPACEFRFLALLGANTVHAAIGEYERLTGSMDSGARALMAEMVTFWARLHYVSAALCNMIDFGQSGPTPLTRKCLRILYGGDWPELDLPQNATINP